MFSAIVSRTCRAQRLSGATRSATTQATTFSIHDKPGSANIPPPITPIRPVKVAKHTPLARVTDQFITYKPITPSIRHLRRPNNPHLYAGKTLRQFTIPERKTGGRNSTQGRITVRFRGGGHKRRIRLVDFKRLHPGPQDVIRIEYDPGRSAHIALVKRRQVNLDAPPDGKGKSLVHNPYSYILACDGLRAGDVVESFRGGIPDDLVPGYKNMMNEGGRTKGGVAGDGAPSTSSLAIGMLRAKTVKPGNVLPLRLIPTGTMIHNIALDINGPGILVRSAGTFAVIIAHEENTKYTQVRLQSGEVRKILKECVATIGKVSNPLHKNARLGKAGRRRWLGFRPRVRGMAMNPVDHPHGGGRGKSKGNKHPRSVWGWLTKGRRTRKPGPKGPPGNNKMVVRERPRGKDKQRG
ncbi:ribosomal protein L2 [Sistotremastrum niveocremeum HHB9708]|uniref:Large ribosomal subunit protein uL2m n=1 Tax=Sistotremastrum niveocremeum HHB9708 TaxID=1314777 RepID=A0A164ULQ0_9AGAM|nr:ribosomal protein L2 [Sistotremastrum niveocremeum HHB9708]